MRKAWPQIPQINFFSGSVLALDASGETKAPAEAPLQGKEGISSSGPSVLCGDLSSSLLDKSPNEGSDSSDSRWGHLPAFSCPSEVDTAWTWRGRWGKRKGGGQMGEKERHELGFRLSQKTSLIHLLAGTWKEIKCKLRGSHEKAPSTGRTSYDDWKTWIIKYSSFQNVATAFNYTVI